MTLLGWNIEQWALVKRWADSKGIRFSVVPQVRRRWSDADHFARGIGLSLSRCVILRREWLAAGGPVGGPGRWYD